MSHRKNRARIAERQRQKEIERGDMIDKMAANPWFQRRAKNLRELINFNVRSALGIAAGFTFLQGIDPWTNSVVDRAVFVLFGVVFSLALWRHKQWCP